MDVLPSFCMCCQAFGKRWGAQAALAMPAQLGACSACALLLGCPAAAVPCANSWRGHGCCAWPLAPHWRSFHAALHRCTREASVKDLPRALAPLQLVRRGGVELDVAKDLRFFDFGQPFARGPSSLTVRHRAAVGQGRSGVWGCQLVVGGPPELATGVRAHAA